MPLSTSFDAPIKSYYSQRQKRRFNDVIEKSNFLVKILQGPFGFGIERYRFTQNV